MRAQEHDLVGLLGAPDFRDHVLPFPRTADLIFDLERNRQIETFFEQARESQPVLARDLCDRQGDDRAVERDRVAVEKVAGTGRGEEDRRHPARFGSLQHFGAREVLGEEIVEGHHRLRPDERDRAAGFGSQPVEVGPGSVAGVHQPGQQGSPGRRRVAERDHAQREPPGLYDRRRRPHALPFRGRVVRLELDRIHPGPAEGLSPPLQRRLVGLTTGRAPTDLVAKSPQVVVHARARRENFRGDGRECRGRSRLPARRRRRSSGQDGGGGERDEAEAPERGSHEHSSFAGGF